ncbi:MAG: glutamate--tRNA ligase, partial [Halorientalis sp.]
QFVYDYFGWEYPEVVHWGRIEVDGYDVPLSTSAIRERIADGRLEGWDDPRAPTLASLRRRGIRGEAVVDAMVELGVSTSNADLSTSAIYSANRELIDDGATRRFLVLDGVEVPLSGAPAVGEPPRHPEHPERGDREIPVGESVLLEADDYPDPGERVWLKGLGCARREDGALTYAGDDLSAVREEGVPVVHWVPARGSRPVTLRRVDGDETGRAEPGLAEQAVDDVVQFERVGFARVDDHADDETVAYFAHR